MNSKKPITLSVAISTVAQRSTFLISMIRQSKSELSNADEVIIVLQATSAEIEQAVYSEWKNCAITAPLKIIATNYTGLSKSRNAALKTGSTDYIWILDDDVQIITGAIHDIKNELSFHRADILCGRIQCRGSESMFKKYIKSGRLRKVDLLKVMSIEMIISNRFFDELNVSFNEQFGLGTDLPAGEETIFLIDAHEHGAAIRHSAIIIAKHECDEQNFYKKWSKPGVLRAKGIVARRMGLIIGPLLIARWGFRSIRRGLYPNCLRYLLEGFLKTVC